MRDEVTLTKPPSNSNIKERSRFSTTLNNPEMTYLNPDIKKGKKFLEKLFRQKEHMRAQRHIKNWNFKDESSNRRFAG